MTNASSSRRILTRRRLLAASSAALAGLAAPRFGLAAALPPTPAQTPGPFYPKVLPLASGNDLVQVAGHADPASGTVVHVFGRILAADGNPVPGALVEIWQCDSHGRYHHVDDRPSPPPDPNFQGYGKTVADGAGGYRFRTIRPVPYPGRTPHIHFAVTMPGGASLVTQMYVAGEPLNARDPVLNAIRDPAARARVVVPLAPAPEFEPEALAGAFDIVLGA